MIIIIISMLLLINIPNIAQGDPPVMIYDKTGYKIESISWNLKTNQAYVLVSTPHGGFEDKLHIFQNDILVEERESPIYGRAIAWRPDGSYAIIAGTSNSIVLYNDTFQKHIDISVSWWLYDLSWKPDGTEALIAGDRLIRYNALSESISDVYNISSKAVAWRPDGSFALIASDNGNIYKFEDGEIKDVTPSFSSGRGFSVYGISWKPDNDLSDGYQGYALLCGRYKSVFRYDGSDFIMLASSHEYCSNDTFKSIDYSPTYHFQDVAWNPSGEYAILVGNEHCGGGVVAFYNETIIKGLSTDLNHSLVCCAWDVDGRYLFFGGYRHEINSTTGNHISIGGLYTYTSEDIQTINRESTKIIDVKPNWVYPLVAVTMLCVLSSTYSLYLYFRKNYA